VPWLTWRGQKWWLLITSYVFYAAWDPVFIVLLWLSTVVDWTAACWILASRSQGRRKLLLVVSVVLNLGVLAYFKYAGFILDNVVRALHAAGIDYHPAAPDIVLPIGISFYTFHTLSYTLDVYLRRTQPWSDVLDFALYVTFFPALVAGPILRASQFLPQCVEPRRTTGRTLAWGCALLAVGLFAKNAIADVVTAPVADAVFAGAATHPPSTSDAWLGTLAFATQIYCDFAGYSLCAIGAALCLGFSIPDNFRAPYAARGFSDFWTRWHISLSTWLRDYLYIPLGGNRRGPARTYVNLVLTMLIGGLWHGPSWTFVVWGGLHGAYLIGERLVGAALPAGAWRESSLVRAGTTVLTFALVCLAWVFFRAASFDEAGRIVRALVGLTPGGATRELPLVDYRLVLGAFVGVVGIQWALRDRSFESVVERTPWAVRGIVLGVLVAALVVMQGEERAFIYFQF